MTAAVSKRGWPILERFWSNVLIGDGCWEWQAGRNREGYGKFWTPENPNARAHRFAYETEIGPIPDGMHVCHHCDNPPCVRPTHLYLGDDAKNLADMVLRGRSTRGTRNAHNKLSEAQVLEIRSRAGRESDCDLAREFGVTSAMVRFIRTRANWRHI